MTTGIHYHQNDSICEFKICKVSTSISGAGILTDSSARIEFLPHTGNENCTAPLPKVPRGESKSDNFVFVTAGGLTKISGQFTGVGQYDPRLRNRFETFQTN